jgi:hypothetical protein
MTTIRTDLQKRAEGAILQHALFRWESAAVIAVTILLFFFLRRPFPGGRPSAGRCWARSPCCWWSTPA